MDPMKTAPPREAPVKVAFSRFVHSNLPAERAYLLLQAANNKRPRSTVTIRKQIISKPSLDAA